MAEPNWTPGPWSYSNGALIRVCKPTSKPITICGVHRIGRFSGADESVPVANARLIAAAPELYEALAELLDASLTETPLKESAGRRAFARDKARAALAKARDDEEGLAALEDYVATSGGVITP